MKKIIGYILLFLVMHNIISSCERDDICIDEITPHLILRFYNNENRDNTKNANFISAKIVGVENDSISLSARDSIALPLKVTEVSTQYIITIKNRDNSINRDTLTVNYEHENVFVGRSCGYKTIFSNATYTLQTGSENWIRDIESITQTINNEKAAHVKIFH